MLNRREKEWHGELVNVYIARKRSRGGKRFGFVRMKILEEANRVTQRLHGATLYGSRMVVKIARDNQGRGWKRNTTCRSKSTEYKKTGFGMDDEAIVQKDGDVWVMFAGSSHGRKSIPIGVTTVILALEIY
ncbi:hypothetical protein V6N12_046928 [Hibiscus sabdariffa]|uniref:RRM domain-containing protein n=1 Tax=Hibiscus sabdariffa TaxID=183260 RepID=A0ABR2BC20_9ROSI